MYVKKFQFFIYITYNCVHLETKNILFNLLLLYTYNTYSYNNTHITHTHITHTHTHTNTIYLFILYTISTLLLLLRNNHVLPILSSLLHDVFLSCILFYFPTSLLLILLCFLSVLYPIS